VIFWEDYFDFHFFSSKPTSGNHDKEGRLQLIGPHRVHYPTQQPTLDGHCRYEIIPGDGYLALGVFASTAVIRFPSTFRETAR